MQLGRSLHSQWDLRIISFYGYLLYTNDRIDAGAPHLTHKATIIYARCAHTASQALPGRTVAHVWLQLHLILLSWLPYLLLSTGRRAIHWLSSIGHPWHGS